tara:strand:+ start:4216 stop:5280 length:1065 start_codon:yes stop_codon:yes gene_type:complete
MINLDDLKFQFLKLINKIEVLDIQRNRSLNKNKNIYILFLKNLGLGDMIMLSPLITLLKKKNFNKIIIVSHFPNIFDENIERIDLKTFFFKIIFDRNSLVISPSINFIHSFLILFPINKMGFFSSSKFFSNIKNLEISYKFDPILDHFNTRLIPFFKALDKTKNVEYEYPKISQKKVSSIKNLEKSIIICPFKTEDSMKWPIENFIDLISKIKKKITKNIFLITGKDKNSLLLVKYISKKTDTSVLQNLDISEINYTINQCNLFIGLDTFMSHLSFFSDRPSIILYGSTSSDLRKPKNTKRTLFMEDKGKTCNHFPCWNSVNKSECYNKNKHSCINSIYPEDVFKKIMSLNLSY